MVSVRDIVDAIVADLGTLPLPEHRVSRYIKPRALRGDLAPWLCVYPTGINPELVSTTSDYEGVHVVEVTWSEDVFIGQESNMADEDTALRALGRAQLINDRLRTYGAGVPELRNVTAVFGGCEYRLAGSGSLWQCVSTLEVEVFE